MNIHGMENSTQIKLFDAMGNVKRVVKLTSKKKRTDTMNIVVKSKGGIIIGEYNDIPVKSFVGNYISRLAATWAGTNYAGSLWLQLNGSAGSSPAYNTNMRLDAGVNVAYGIRVGTSNTAVDIAQYSLQGVIGQGTSAGQLTHAAMSISVPVLDGNSYRLTVSRTLTNNTLSDITILEAGVYGGSTTQYMIIRDVLNYNGDPINITLSAGQSVEVVYNLYFDLSEDWVNNIISGQIYGAFANVSNGVSTKDTDGDTVNTGAFTTGTPTPPYLLEGASASTYGILVGTGNTTVAITDYNVEGKISHGTGAGQLTHGAMSVYEVPTQYSQSVKYSVARTFTNNSAGQIIVKNMGVVTYGLSSPNQRLLMLRKLTGNIVVDNGEAFQIIQTFEIVNA